MNAGGLMIRFGRGRPAHHQPVHPLLGLKGIDIFHQLVGQIHFMRTFFHMGTIKIFHIVPVKNSRHWNDAFQFLFDPVDMARFQHHGLAGGLVSRVGEDIPAAENQVLQVGQGNQLLHREDTFLGTLAQADFSRLGHGTQGPGQSLVGSKYPGQ